jgi:hypothetical protein
MDLTRLNLLTRDGAVSVVFEPALEPEHYAILRNIVRDVDTEGELRVAVTKVAAEWNRDVYFD